MSFSDCCKMALSQLTLDATKAANLRSGNSGSSCKRSMVWTSSDTWKKKWKQIEIELLSCHPQYKYLYCPTEKMTPLKPSPKPRKRPRERCWLTDGLCPPPPLGKAPSTCARQSFEAQTSGQTEGTKPQLRKRLFLSSMRFKHLHWL